MRVFAHQRFVNMARLIREICQHEKPPANKITERPAFTVIRNKSFAVKAIVLVRFSARTLLGGSHQWGKKQNKAMFEEKEGNWGASADARFQGGTRENRISRIKPLPRNTRRGVHAFWGLWHLDGLLTLFKYLFFSTTRARFKILFWFFRNMLALIMAFLSASNFFSFFGGGELVPERLQ